MHKYNQATAVKFWIATARSVLVKICLMEDDHILKGGRGHPVSTSGEAAVALLYGKGTVVPVLN